MGMRLMRFLMVFISSVVTRQLALTQTGALVDVFPLAIGSEWIYRYQRVDSLPYANPATYTLDTGTVSYEITAVSSTDPVHWTFEEHRDLRRQIHYLSSSRPDSFTVIRDSSTFAMLEELQGQHRMYRNGLPNYYESLGVFSFDRDFTDTTSVYRYRPVGPDGSVTFLSEVPPGDIPFVFTFEEEVGITHVYGYWSILSGRVYCTHQLLSSSQAGPLPIQLYYLNAVPVGSGNVQLEWGTLSELNNYGFEVQKRLTGQEEYETIPNSFVPGNGTTNVPHEYTYVDRNVGPGSLFYRLRQIDLDGRVHLTEGVQVSLSTSVEGDVPNVFALSQNYPNPFNPQTTIEFSLPKETNVLLRLVDVLGREVRILDNGRKSAGKHVFSLDLHDLGSGAYFYQLIGDGRVETKRLTLIK